MNLDEIRTHMQERDFAANGVFKTRLAGETQAQARVRVLQQLADDVPDLVAELERKDLQIERLNECYTACEQCDVSTGRVQFCAKCWNSLAKRAIDVETQVADLTKKLSNSEQLWKEFRDFSSRALKDCGIVEGKLLESGRINDDVREKIVKLLDACFCDDTGDRPECEACQRLRKVLVLLPVEAE